MTFALTANAVARSNPPAATGTFTLSTSQWELTGTISRYVLVGSAGSVSGTGSLYWWNPALNKGKGGWQLAKSGVAFTASFAATVHGTKPGSPARSAINIAYSPAAPQPALPNSAPQPLGGGTVGGS